MRDAEEINSFRRQYGYEGGPVCARCGKPTDSVALTCEQCLEALSYQEELLYAKNWLRENPGVQIELAHDKKKFIHLVQFRVPDQAWCGAHVTQARKTRKVTPPGNFPVGTCDKCIEVYEGVAQ